jgi:hypothetical protein
VTAAGLTGYGQDLAVGCTVPFYLVLSHHHADRPAVWVWASTVCNSSFRCDCGLLFLEPLNSFARSPAA